MLRTAWFFALNASLAVVLVVVYLMVAPASLGGGFKSATISGISMNPLLHVGDLAVVREQRTYNVGDIVLYQSEIGAQVLHRIVAKSGNTFTLKGDNNSFEDSEHPTNEQVIGKYLFMAPSGGKTLSLLRSPSVLAALFAGTLFALFNSIGGRRPQKRPGTVTLATNAPRRFEFVQTPFGQSVGIAAAVAAAAVLFLALLLSSGSGISSERTTAYTLGGSFTFASARGDGAPLPAGLAAPNQPVFFTVADRMTVTYAYEADGATIDPALSTTRMTASVRADNGWRAEVPLTQSGDAGVRQSTASLQLADVQRTVKELEDSTGLVLSNFYLDFTANSRVGASVEGAATTAVFGPTLSFRGDKTQLQLWAPGGTDDPLHPQLKQSVQTQETQPQRLKIGPLTLSTAQAQALVVALTLSVVGAVVTLALHAAQLRKRPWAERMLATSQCKLVRAAAAPAAATIVELEQMVDFVQVGAGHTVLAANTNGQAGYFVNDGVTWYSYTPALHNERPAAVAGRWKAERGGELS